ncbi:hypothetical protein PHISCL_07733 [Aspergillus sclerotialis]|uniref:Uncharacterized protein n=1 Tax=Aspergillus sclerotialis TaxID=2070753 RepID=A0A3A2ZBE2_9EURO|nr:hypothetical protein PHISCL_07733 [Aspergillus sclerotialis]
MAKLVTKVLLKGPKKNINPSAPSVPETKGPTLAVSKKEPPKPKLTREEPASASTAVPTKSRKSTIDSSTDNKRKRRKLAPKQAEPKPEIQSKPKPKIKTTRYLKKRRQERKVIMNNRPHFTKKMAEAVVYSVDQFDNFQSDNERDKLILTSDTDSGWDD